MKRCDFANLGKVNADGVQPDSGRCKNIAKFCIEQAGKPLLACSR